MRYWVLTGILVVTFLLQSVVATYLSIGGIVPNLLLMLVVSYGLLFGWPVGLFGGLLAGLLADLGTGMFIGAHTLAMGVVGLVAGLVEQKVFKDNILLGPASGFVASVAGQTMILTCLGIFGWRLSPLDALRTMVLPEALFDTVVAALLYGQLHKYYLYLRPDPRGTIVLRRH